MYAESWDLVLNENLICPKCGISSYSKQNGLKVEKAWSDPLWSFYVSATLPEPINPAD
jgi:hypothetical protein